MGEMADFALDQVETEEEDRLFYRLGFLSDEEAYDLGIVNEVGGYDSGANRSSFMTCRYCGTKPLYWMETSTGFRLVDVNKVIHLCEEYKKD